MACTGQPNDPFFAFPLNELFISCQVTEGLLEYCVSVRTNVYRLPDFDRAALLPDVTNAEYYFSCIRTL